MDIFLISQKYVLYMQDMTFNYQIYPLKNFLYHFENLA